MTFFHDKKLHVVIDLAFVVEMKSSLLIQNGKKEIQI